MNKVLDPGHKYQLLTLDGEMPQFLTFVKRFDPAHPEKFPGNFNKHPGTTIQSVIRCLVERVEYLQSQIPCDENIAIFIKLNECLWLLESRAAERHGYSFNYRVSDIFQMPMCQHCGHVVCKQLGNAHR